jgi:Cu(I)/Ag(I) efflux system membrane protein CusA/SilA
VARSLPSSQSSNRLLIRAYHPLLNKVLRYPKTTVALAACSWLRPPGPSCALAENSCHRWTKAICSTCLRSAGLAAGKASQLLQQTDRLIKTVPEVGVRVWQAGRADSATDPAPIEMFETTIR